MTTANMDIAAFIREVEMGDRYALTGEQFIIASQKIIGTAIWRETVRQTDGINTPEARQFRAQRQAWLDENLPYWRRDRTNVGVPQGLLVVSADGAARSGRDVPGGSFYARRVPRPSGTWMPANRLSQRSRRRSLT
jgi:hypothetical protein